jgi:transglutaminase-like putative cysteine protease
MPRASVEGEYEIRQRHAHTWVEAYIDSAGWMTLEATPAYEVPEMLGLMVSGSAAAGRTDGDFDEFLLLTESIAQAQAGTADREDTGKGNGCY